MAVLYAYLLQEENRRALRRDRVFRPRINPLNEFDDIDLISRYRLSRNLILDLCNSLGDKLVRNTQRNQALSVETQIFTALRFYASGCFYMDTASGHGISKASVSRAVHAVTEALCENVNEYISFPLQEDSIRRNKTKLYEIAQFPNVIGLIDGTQIPIKGPSVEEHLYICRKGYHSINVQIVCDANLKILDVVSKWPGSAHDAYIWTNSGLRQKILDSDIIGYLLGDSGYPISPTLLTPF